jgi:protein MpaA
VKKPKKLKKLKKKHIVIALISLPILLILGSVITISVIASKDVMASDSSIGNSEEFCINGNFLLPESYTVNTTFPIEISFKNKTTLFDKYDVRAETLCIKPLSLLKEKETYDLEISFLGKTGLSLFKKELPLVANAYPLVKGMETEDKVNITEILEYELDSENEFLDYTLIVDDREIDCLKEDLKILCDISSLELEYDQQYWIRIVATHEDEYIQVFDPIQIETLSAIRVTSSSIDNNEIVTTPNISEINIEVNKEIKPEGEVVIKDSKGNEIELEVEFEGKGIKILPQESFKQNYSYSLHINNLLATDDSTLQEEYVLKFSISDGPRIYSSNIESTGFPATQNILLTFTQTLRSQDIKKYIKLNSQTNYSFSITGNKVLINPTSNLEACKNNTLAITDGIIGITGLISTKTYTYNFKTSCARVAGIGTSVEGRGIYAYYYGTGSKKILFYGAIHGSEVNSRNILNKWLGELEKNYARIPADKTVIVVPTLNPDGVVNASRFNSNGVDLNRNFAASDWVSGTYFKETFYENGGGSEPFSEPESQTIRTLINSQYPYLTIAYHSAAGYVIPSTTALAQEYGGIYSQLSGYGYVAPTNHDAFSYDITGSFDIWAGENGYNSLTIELASAYYDEFDRNLSAMWKMVEL